MDKNLIMNIIKPIANWIKNFIHLLIKPLLVIIYIYPNRMCNKFYYNLQTWFENKLT